MQLAPILHALRRGDWREAHVMSDLGAYPVASGQATPAPARPHATAELLLLARMAGIEAPELAPLARALADSEPTIRSALALGDAARLKKAIEAPRDQIRADLFVDRLLGSGLASKETVDRELAEVKARGGKYGSPFDSRKSIVRIDALLWLAALADPADRTAIVSGPMRFYGETSSRVPAPDQVESDSGRPAGTQARPVLGAAFAPLLLHEPRARR
jgi:hypothetical protein